MRDNSAHMSGIFPEACRVFCLGNGVVESRRVDWLRGTARVGRPSQDDQRMTVERIGYRLAVSGARHRSVTQIESSVRPAGGGLSPAFFM
jgi:hypothetical protein